MNSRYAIIVATDLANGIGKNNSMPWHISEDLKRFKELTTGHAVIMGRKTWESLPKKPLPNRTNIVITRNGSYEAEGAITVTNPADVMQHTNPNQSLFIIGGAEIYKLFYAEATRLYRTLVKDTFECDTTLDVLSESNWEITNQSNVRKDPKSGLEYQYIDYKRQY
ncbi:MAG: dihydrofolate reductase [Salinivirgaceae bacterium]